MVYLRRLIILKYIIFFGNLNQKSAFFYLFVEVNSKQPIDDAQNLKFKTAYSTFKSGVLLQQQSHWSIVRRHCLENQAFLGFK